MKRVYMDRFIDSIEWVAAGFVGIVAANIFISVVLRNLFTYSIPDSYDFGRLMLGILIFWGIAATSYRGTHITVDLVWGNVGPKYQRMIDVFATLVLLFVVSVQTYTLVRQGDDHAHRQRAHLRSAPADLAVLHGRLAGRRVGGAADRHPHLPPDCPAGIDGRNQDQAGRVTR